MEDRLGQSLDEDPGESRLEDISDDADLLTPNPEAVASLRTLLADAAPAGVRGDTPREVAALVEALRQKVVNEARQKRGDGFLRRVVRRLLGQRAPRRDRPNLVRDRHAVRRKWSKQ
jgi:hypothetical protein